MKVALVHEYLNQFGGAERMLQVFSALFPNAPIYTLFYDAKATRHIFSDKEIRTSFLQRVPFIKRYHRLFPLVMPMAVEQFDFSDFDLVISISASFAKGIITNPSTKHICYCLTPPRFLWDDSQKFVEDFNSPGFIKKALPPLITYLRVWDREAAMRVDKYLAISEFVRSRIKKYYHRESDILYPVIDVDRFKPRPGRGEYYFTAGRLVQYKRFDLAVKAFNKLGLPLKIAGVGPELSRLKKIAKSNIEFLGLVSDNKLAELYSNSKAFIFPQEEDFGMTLLEAMASGKPVIAYRGGGAVETIIENKTGIFFNEQTEDSLIEAIQKFKEEDFKSLDCVIQANKFSLNSFRNNLFNKLKTL